MRLCTLAVTEYEIERGMLSCPASCNASSLCFMRSIRGLTDNLSDKRARMYVDVVQDKSRSSSSSSSSSAAAELDVEAQTLLEELREKVTSCLTDERNLEYFQLDWKKDKRSNPSDDPQYLSWYLLLLSLCWWCVVAAVMFIATKHYMC